MVDQICTAIDNAAYNPPVTTITDVGESSPAGMHLFRNGAMHGGGTLQLRRNSNNSVRGQISLAQLQAFEAVLLTESYSPTTYRNVKNNLTWQAIHNYAMRPLFHADKTGTVTMPQTLTVPCRQCGVLLHHKLVSVDHVNPKAGDPLDAIYKVFRAVGYTNQDPTGPKGQTISGIYAAGVGGLTGGGGLYGLNPPGMIVYSIFRGSNYWPNLKALTMHHFVNLRPVCSFCNPSLGAKM